MLYESPVLDIQGQMIDTCREILRDKMQMITSALALQGRVKRIVGYDPLAGALAQLAIVSRKMNPDDFDPQTFKAAVEAADDRWWEWFDNRPKSLIVPIEAMNYSPRLSERLALREQLRAKYTVKVEAAP